MKKQAVEVGLEELKNCIIQAMFDKKARNIVSIDLRKLNNSFSDYFLICHGTSKPHVEAIGDYIEEMTRQKLHQKPLQKEGYENKEWILLDYFDIVVHVFLEERRDFFAIEELWGDGELEEITDIPVSEIKSNQKIKTNGRKNQRKG